MIQHRFIFMALMVSGVSPCSLLAQDKDDPFGDPFSSEDPFAEVAPSNAPMTENPFQVLDGDFEKEESEYSPPPVLPAMAPGRIVLPLQVTVEEFELNESKPSQSPETPVRWLTDLESATTDARINNRRMFVIVGADWCGFCKQLENEIGGSTEQTLAQTFTLAKIDADSEILDATHLQASALPAIRVLTMNGRIVGRRDGYVSSESLLSWLDEIESNAETDAILAADVNSLDESSISKLVALLGQRDVTTRSIVIRRLADNPEKSSAAVVDAFENGTLGLRLAAIRLLRRWDAPVEGMDPWRPNTIDGSSIQRLRKWLETTTASSIKQAPAVEDTQKDEKRAAIRRRMEQWLVRPDALIEAEIADLTGDSTWVNEIGIQMMRDQTQQSEAQSSRLRRLVYTLSAGDETRLDRGGSLRVLAEGKTNSRRLTADKVALAAKKDDVALLNAMLADEDALIREIALRHITRVAPNADPSLLTQLLIDPDENVRAGVLKQLAILQSEKAIPAVKQYIAREEDNDLIIYAIRFLQATKNKEVFPILVDQTKRESWQVRAAAVEALGEVLSANASHRSIAAHEAILLAAKDEDSFVAAKAAAQLDKVLNVESVPEVLQIARHRPEIAKSIAESLQKNEVVAKATIIELRRLANRDEEADQRFAITLALETRRNRKLDKTPDYIIEPTGLVAIAESTSDLKLKADALRLLLQELQQLVFKEFAKLPAYSKPDEVFSERQDASVKSRSSLVDGEPFESKTGLRDLFSQMELDEVQSSFQPTVSVNHTPLRRVDQFFGLKQRESDRKRAKLLPKPTTQRNFFTAIWNGNPARIRARSLYQPVSDRIEQIYDSSEDASVRGLAAAIQLLAGHRDSESIPRGFDDIVAWVKLTKTNSSQNPDDIHLQTPLIYWLPETEFDDDHHIHQVNGSRERLFDLLWDPKDQQLQGELLMSMATPPGLKTFQFQEQQLKQLSKKDDSKELERHFQSLLVSTSFPRPDLYKKFSRHTNFSPDAGSLAPEIEARLVQLCQPYEPSAMIAFRVLASHKVDSTLGIARRWLGDSDAPQEYQLLAVLGIAAIEKVTAPLMEQILAMEDAQIRLSGLRLLTRQNAFSLEINRNFGNSNAISDIAYHETVKGIDASVLEKLAASEVIEESALATAFLVLSDPSREQDLEPLVRHSMNDVNDSSRLELLMDLLVLRDRESDSPVFEKAMAQVNQSMDEWERRQVFQKVRRMKTKALRELAPPEEQSTGSFFDFFK